MKKNEQWKAMLGEFNIIFEHVGGKSKKWRLFIAQVILKIQENSIIYYKVASQKIKELLRH